MSLAGKILLFVNLLAAGGLVYLTTQDYSKRQEINGTALRYYMALHGLPVAEPADKGDGDDVPMAIPTTGGHVTTTVGKKLLDAHFGGAGTAVLSQVEEVKAVQQRMLALVAGKPADLDKLRLLCGGLNANKQYEAGLLTRFAETYEERLAIKALTVIDDPAKIPGNLTDARKRLDRKFEAVLNNPKPADAQADAAKIAELQEKLRVNPNDAAAAAEASAVAAFGPPPYTRDDADRRERIAQLLMLENTAGEAQKRVLKIVGLHTYVRSLNGLTGRVEEVVRRAHRGWEQDQSVFVDEYELLKRLALQQDTALYQQTRVLEELKAQLKKDSEAVNARTKHADELLADVTLVQKDVADLLKAQAEVEANLFAVQKKVGQTLVGNLSKEKDLLNAEQGKK